jgi:hypothetical protein
MIIGNMKMYKPIRILSMMCVALSGAIPAVAQDDEPEIKEDVRNCINLRTLRRTDVIDDRTVLFYMRGRTVYLNMLPRQCGGLAREGRFSYTTSIGSLCSQDSIRVLYGSAYGLGEGNRCKLGMFQKITREDAKALKDTPLNAPAANPLPMPPPQEVGTEESDPESD